MARGRARGMGCEDDGASGVPRTRKGPPSARRWEVEVPLADGPQGAVRYRFFGWTSTGASTPPGPGTPGPNSPGVEGSERTREGRSGASRPLETPLLTRPTEQRALGEIGQCKKIKPRDVRFRTARSANALVFLPCPAPFRSVPFRDSITLCLIGRCDFAVVWIQGMHPSGARIAH